MEASADDLGYVAQFGELIGASEGALRLLISLLAGYPLALFHRSFLYGKSPSLQHIYFILCGVFLCYFNFGNNVIHSLNNILLIYVLLLTCGGTSLSIALAYTINVGYLIMCYYSTLTGDTSYAITWSMPHCVLTLRLTGLVLDVYDGKQEYEKLSSEQKETALKQRPSLLEIAGHTYFFGGFLVGPQFPMKRYRDFIDGKFSDPVTNEVPATMVPSLQRLAAGALYTLVFQVGGIFLPDSYLSSLNFQELSLPSKCLIVTLWGKLTLYKYVGCWLITEGACILTGLTYNGRDENGNHLWNACANINIRDFELASSGQGFIGSFNVNTNRWMGKYVFKRLKWLGNKNISQGITLFFLALWHGVQSGYYSNFFIEFIMIQFERSLRPILVENKIVKTLSNFPPIGPLLLWVVAKLYAQFSLGYALVSFTLLTYNRYMAVYASMYFIGHVVFIATPLLIMLMKPKRRSAKQE